MPEITYKDPRLKMTLAGRMFVRAGAAIGLIIFAVATALFIASGMPWLVWLGLFMALALLDRAIHANQGDVPIPELVQKEKIDAAQALSPRVHPVLEHAFEKSAVAKIDLALTLAYKLLREREIRAGLVRLDIDHAAVLSKLEDLAEREEARVGMTHEERCAYLEKIMSDAFVIAAKNGHRFISATDIFSVLGKANGLVARLFTMFDIEDGDLERAFIFTTAREHRGLLGRMPGELSGIILPASRGARHRIMNRAWTSRPTPTLDKFGTDYTDAAREQAVGFLIGHEGEYEHMVTVLSRDTNPNAMLVGEEGAGKETLIAHLAFRIEKDEVPPALFDRRLVSLNIAELMAGGSPEELQARLQKIVEEISLAGNIILLIPDIHNLAKTSGAGYMSAADALMPIIRSNAFPILGTTFPREYRSVIEQRSDFAGMFETVQVEEVSDEDAERILVYQAMVLESQTKVTVTFGAVKSSVALARKYFRNLLLPGSAIALLKSAVTGALGRGDKLVTHEDVVSAAETRINVPLHENTQEENEKLLKLEDTIHQRLVDQEEAVRAVADSLRQYRSGLSRKGGPIASFLFVGPTGVGKTELAKILADLQFGSQASMMRFDMTEYKEKESISRFIGSPDGSGSGTLTEALKNQPYGLILLDEFEKAAPDITDLFLQALDDGRLTDASGRTLSLENTIIIATSNAHSDIINDALRKGESMASIADYLKTRLTDVFKPELINRFSKVVIFHNLRMEDMEKIAAIELKKLAGSLLDKGISIQFGDGVLGEIAKRGYDPAFGARPLKRAVDEHLRAPLASWLLANNPSRGAEIAIRLENGQFTFISADRA